MESLLDFLVFIVNFFLLLRLTTSLKIAVLINLISCPVIITSKSESDINCNFKKS